mgnify:CR=1 FL=1
MDTKIHRPQPQCSRTGRPFLPGDALVSTLVRSPEGLLRVDVGAASWTGPPEKCLAWWRCTYPRPDAAGNVLAPSETLLDLVEQLGADPAEETLRYLLALELVRRRVLRFLDPSGEGADDGRLRLGCRKRDCEYVVTVAPPGPGTAKETETRLAALLWSGEAA